MRAHFDREMFEALSGPFVDWPLIQCPHCRMSSLEPTLEVFEDSASLTERNDPDWDPGRIFGFFYGTYGCSRTQCNKRHAVAGAWRVDWDPELSVDEDLDEETLTKSYEVKFAIPPLPIAELPEKVPNLVQDLVESASSVILSDPSAAANRIRSAIEATLDDQRVKKLKPNRRDRLTTHGRILEFQAKNPDAAELLMAMKWIGNLGSHERSPLPLNMVLDGIELFAGALELIYDRRKLELARRAAQINKRGSRLRPPVEAP